MMYCCNFVSEYEHSWMNSSLFSYLVVPFSRRKGRGNESISNMMCLCNLIGEDENSWTNSSPFVHSVSRRK